MILSERCGYVLLAIALAIVSVVSIARGFPPKRTLSSLLLATCSSFAVAIMCLPMYLTPDSGAAAEPSYPLMVVPTSYVSFVVGYSGSLSRAVWPLFIRCGLMVPIGAFAPVSAPGLAAPRRAIPLFALIGVSIDLIWALQCLLVGNLYRPISFDGALSSFMGLMLGYLAFHLCSRIVGALRKRRLSR